MPDDITQQCAAQVHDTIHLIMRTIGPEMRKRAQGELSFQQFRVMKHVEHHSGISLSELATHLGVTISSASKIIDGLVEKGCVARETALDDRRKLVLAITEAGKAVFASMDLQAVACLSEKLASLTPSECAMVNLSMELIRSTLAQARVNERCCNAEAE